MLTVVGAAALACMIVCYALEARSPWFVLAFGLACLWASAYGWLVGAWPFGIGEGLWGLLALRRWARAVDGDRGGVARPKARCPETGRPSTGGSERRR
jgi:hypothetical protein